MERHILNSDGSLSKYRENATPVLKREPVERIVERDPLKKKNVPQKDPTSSKTFHLPPGRARERVKWMKLWWLRSPTLTCRRRWGANWIYAIWPTVYTILFTIHQHFPHCGCNWVLGLKNVVFSNQDTCQLPVQLMLVLNHSYSNIVDSFADADMQSRYPE